MKDFETLKKHDMVCAMVSGVPGRITTGLNRLENAQEFVPARPDVLASLKQGVTICDV